MEGPPPRYTVKSIDEYLEHLSKGVFQAGMSWRVVDAKWPTTRKAFHEVGSERSLERVPHGDPERGGRGARGGDVHDEGPEQHGGPDPESHDEECRERDPGRGPDRGGAGVLGGEAEPDLPRDHVGHGDDDEGEDVPSARAGNAHERSVLGPDWPSKGVSG